MKQKLNIWVVLAMIVLVSWVYINYGKMQTQSIYDSRYPESCDDMYDRYVADDTKQCVAKATLDSDMRDCLEDCGEDFRSTDVCVVFYENDPCRTTKGGSFGTRDACNYVCISQGVYVDPCADECTVGDVQMISGQCRRCTESSSQFGCNYYGQYSGPECPDYDDGSGDDGGDDGGDDVVVDPGDGDDTGDDGDPTDGLGDGNDAEDTDGAWDWWIETLDGNENLAYGIPVAFVALLGLMLVLKRK